MRRINRYRDGPFNEAAASQRRGIRNSSLGRARGRQRSFNEAAASQRRGMCDGIGGKYRIHAAFNEAAASQRRGIFCRATAAKHARYDPSMRPRRRNAAEFGLFLPYGPRNRAPSMRPRRRNAAESRYDLQREEPEDLPSMRPRRRNAAESDRNAVGGEHLEEAFNEAAASQRRGIPST